MSKAKSLLTSPSARAHGTPSHTASLASGEELDCNYVTTIPVMMIIRYGCTPVGNYELGAAQDVIGI